MNLLNSLLSVNLFSRTLLVFFLCTSAAWAGNSVSGSYALSPWVYKKLEGARVSIDEEDYLIAETQLRSLVENNKLSSYEKAQSWNLLAYNYYLSKQPLASIKAYQRVLQEPQLSPGLQQSTLKTLAQLQYGEEQYRQALNNLSLLEQRTSLDNNLNLLKAYCLYQLDSFRAAAQVLDGLIANSQLPQENWLTLLQASYHQLGDFKRMTDTLELLVRYYPTIDHLLTLASIYGEINRADKQLATLESLWESQQLKTEADILNLVALQLQLGAPFKAAKILQQSITKGFVVANEQHRLQLAQAWMVAKEEHNAIVALEDIFKKTEGIPSGKAISGSLSTACLLLGQLYFTQADWQKAIDRLKVCKSNDSDKLNQGRMLLAIAFVNSGQLLHAQRILVDLQTLVQYEQQAGRWLQYIRNEKRRLAEAL